MPTAADAKRAIRREAKPELATFHRRYFRTGPGEYGHGDKFLGLKVPTTRRISREFRELILTQIQALLRSPFHEDRQLALFVLVHRAQRATPKEQLRLAAFYLKNRSAVNNWDLVDVSAPYILGPVFDEMKPAIEKLSRSTSLWDRRISILAHFQPIRAGDTKPFLRFATRFLTDEEDLIHKATGWLLRECGQKDPAGLRSFLDNQHTKMPRTMLRYAIEKIPTPERRRYLARS